MTNLFGTCKGCFNHRLCKKDGLCTEPLSCEYYYPISGEISYEEIYEEEQTRRLAYQSVQDQFV
jgi:hypothetical protein